MKTTARTPHFLRVTQALAFVSGFAALGAPAVGCGGSTTSGSLVDPEIDAANDTSIPEGTRIAPDDSGDEFMLPGLRLAPDAESPPKDAGDLDVVFSGSRDGPSVDATGDLDVVFSGSRDGPSVDATDDQPMVVGGGIGPPPDASSADAINGILIAPEAGHEGGGPFDLPDLPEVDA
jgi:hypothetical protein